MFLKIHFNVMGTLCIYLFHNKNLDINKNSYFYLIYFFYYLITMHTLLFEEIYIRDYSFIK